MISVSVSKNEHKIREAGLMLGTETTSFVADVFMAVFVYVLELKAE